MLSVRTYQGGHKRRTDLVGIFATSSIIGTPFGHFHLLDPFCDVVLRRGTLELTIIASRHKSRGDHHWGRICNAEGSEKRDSEKLDELHDRSVDYDLIGRGLRSE